MTADIGTFIAELAVSAVVGGAGALLALGTYREKIKRIEKDHEKLDVKVTEMKSELDKLLEFKTSATKYIDSKIYKDQSPLSLTTYGQKLVTDSGFKEIFENTKDDLVSMLEQQNPSSQYDVQEKARALMDSLTEYAPFELIKKYAFEHGADFGQILRAGGILLRDYYFEKHSEIVNPNEQY